MQAAFTRSYDADLSLKLAKIPVECEMSGDSLLNYIVNHSKNAPITLQQGSFIEMTGPKRACGIPFTNRINGDCGAVDITLALVPRAVEATEVGISEVQSGFNLSSVRFVFINEIKHFHGTIGEPCVLRRFVVAVVMDTMMHLEFKVGKMALNILSKGIAPS
ncbi:hypothetical protein EJB05_29393, partial [Eragrostis curvula]